MSTRALLVRAGLLALPLAYLFAIIVGPRAGLGVLLAAGLAMGNFLLMGRRIADSCAAITTAGPEDHKTLTARTLIGGGIRWVLTFFLLWILLDHAHALAVVGGLSCVVAAIALQAFVEFVRAERDPSAGADP